MRADTQVGLIMRELGAQTLLKWLPGASKIPSKCHLGDVGRQGAAPRRRRGTPKAENEMKCIFEMIQPLKKSQAFPPVLEQNVKMNLQAEYETSSAKHLKWKNSLHRGGLGEAHWDKRTTKRTNEYKKTQKNMKKTKITTKRNN